MRTTLTLDDNLAESLKALAYRSGKSFKEIVNETLRAGLMSNENLPRSRPYTLYPHHMGDVSGRIDLDKALLLADRLEEEELVRKLQMKK